MEAVRRVMQGLAARLMQLISQQLASERAGHGASQRAGKGGDGRGGQQGPAQQGQQGQGRQGSAAVGHGLAMQQGKAKQVDRLRPDQLLAAVRRLSVIGAWAVPQGGSQPVMQALLQECVLREGWRQKGVRQQAGARAAEEEDGEEEEGTQRKAQADGKPPPGQGRKDARGQRQSAEPSERFSQLVQMFQVRGCMEGPG